MLWNLILLMPVTMAILLFTWFLVGCSYGIQLTSIIVLSCSTSSSSKTNLLKPLAVLSPPVLVGQKITRITDNGETNLLKPLALSSPLVLVGQKITNITDNRPIISDVGYFLTNENKSAQNSKRFQQICFRATAGGTTWPGPCPNQSHFWLK